MDDLLDLIRRELGIPVTEEDARRDLNQVAGWDSLHLLRLLTVLEERTGRSLSLPDFLEAPSLAGIYAVAVGE
jgi:acyl carrier protein